MTILSSRSNVINHHKIIRDYMQIKLQTKYPPIRKVHQNKNSLQLNKKGIIFLDIPCHKHDGCFFVDPEHKKKPTLLQTFIKAKILCN